MCMWHCTFRWNWVQFHIWSDILRHFRLPTLITASLQPITRPWGWINRVNWYDFVAAQWFITIMRLSLLPVKVFLRDGQSRNIRDLSYVAKLYVCIYNEVWGEMYIEILAIISVKLSEWESDTFISCCIHLS